jgi:CBS domain-containing protein
MKWEHFSPKPLADNPSRRNSHSSHFAAADKNCAVLRKIRQARPGGLVLSFAQERKDNMKVQDVMTYDVQTCRPETNLADAAMRMWRGDCGILPVLANGQKVVGVITDRDICMAAATKHRDPGNIRVKEVISGKVHACSPDTEIHEALKIMQQKQVRRLPIISAEDGRLAGILSMNDVALKAKTERKAELSAEDVENTMRAICTHRPVPPAKPLQQQRPVAQELAVV